MQSRKVFVQNIRMLEFHPDVEKEVLASYSWYEKQAPGLGEDFLSELDFGIFSRIKDPHSFAKVRVSFDTVEWEAGADLDPEFVYSKCRKLDKSPRNSCH